MSYVAPIQDLLREDRLMPLGPGSPVAAFRPKLQALATEAAFAPGRVADPVYAQACLAGLWLYFDFLDESHQISQDLHTVEGSYWHAILHRREPDFGNAKYWFRRVGQHPIFEPLRDTAAKLARIEPTAKGAILLVEREAWDPFAFVDLCEAASQGKGDEMLCRRVQQAEWKLLFEYCYQRVLS